MLQLFHFTIVLMALLISTKYGKMEVADSGDDSHSSSKSSSSFNSHSCTRINCKSDYCSRTEENLSVKRKYRTIDSKEINNSKKDSSQILLRQNTNSTVTIPIWDSSPELEEITDKCVQCICEALGNCNNKKQFSSASDQIRLSRGFAVGPLGITKSYWEDAGSPRALKWKSSSFINCAKDMTCAFQTVKAYMARYPFDCNADGIVNCSDYAAIHYKGPFACQNPLPELYKEHFLNCWTGVSSDYTKPPEEKESWFSLLFKRHKTTSTTTDIITDDQYQQTETDNLITTDQPDISRNQLETSTEPVPIDAISTTYEHNTLKGTEESITNLIKTTSAFNKSAENYVTDYPDITTMLISSYSETVTTNNYNTEATETETNIDECTEQQTEDIAQTEQTENVDYTQTNCAIITGDTLMTNETSTETIKNGDALFTSTVDYNIATISPLINVEDQITSAVKNQTYTTSNNFITNDEMTTETGIGFSLTTVTKSTNLSFTNEKSTVNVPLQIVDISEECTYCICKAASDCRDGIFPENSFYGAFRISEPYWEDAGKPTTYKNGNNSSFISCANNLDCSEHTVKAYMRKYQFDCNEDGVINCTDYMAIHNNGPFACRDPLPQDYLSRFQKCIIETSRFKYKGSSTISQPKGMLNKWFSSILRHIGS